MVFGYAQPAMKSPSPPPPDAEATAAIIAASEAQLDRDASRMPAARAAMSLLRDRMAMDGADPEALALLCRHIRQIDAHLRRGSQAYLQLVPDDIEQVE